MLKPGMMCVTQTGAVAGMGLVGTLPNWSYKRAYSAALTRLGGTAPFTWSISSGALPSGLSIDSGTGIISGTPATSGNSTFTVQVMDSNSIVATRSQTVNFAADANWANVTLLLPFTGSNGAITATDISSIGSTMTRIGGGGSGAVAAISTAKAKFYDSTFHLIAPTAYALQGFNTTTHNSAVDIPSTGDFTIEFWLFPVSFNSAGSNIEQIFTEQPSIGCYTTYNSAGHMSFYHNGGFPTFGTGVMTTGVWHHIAITRSSGTVTFWQDGVALGTMSIGATALGTPTDPVFVGLDSNSTQLPEIYLSEFRMTRAARYTTTFTPPTLPFPGG